MKSLYHEMLSRQTESASTFTDTQIEELKLFCNQIENAYEVIIAPYPVFNSMVTNNVMEIKTRIFFDGPSINELKTAFNTKYLHIYEISVFYVIDGNENICRWKIRCVGEDA